MSDPHPHLTVGQRIQMHRERAGKTRAVLGGLIGRSPEWVKAVEKGRMLTPRLGMLDKISVALRVPLADLVGEHEEQIHALTGPAHAALPQVRAALNEYVAVGENPPTDLRDLAARVSDAWRARHGAGEHRTVIGRLLPDLIREARHAARAYEGSDRQRAQAIYADVLGLAQMFVAYQPAADVLWRLTDRAMTLAVDSGDPQAIGLAAWFLVEALRDSGDWDAAMAVNLDALRDVEVWLDRHGGTDLAAVAGSLHTVAALTAARAGEQGVAWRHLDEAGRLADRLPAGYRHSRTWFSQPVVGFYRVSVAVELCQHGEAIRQADRVPPDTIASRPRRARHLIEVARGLHLGTKKETQTLRVLNEALAAAPETIRYNSYARQIVLDLREKPAPHWKAANDLAVAIGL